MTTFLLIRHATNDTIGHRIAGRGRGVSLNAEGLAQARALAERLAGVRLAALYASPLERTQETAAPIGERLGVPVQSLAEVLEVDYGEWTGLTLDELRASPGWQAWNGFRSGSRVPGGETLLEVQLRMVGALERLRCEHAGDRVVGVVSHGDPIKAAIGYYAGVPIDLLSRLEIAPASVSALRIEPWGAHVVRLNDTGPLVLP